MAKLERLQALKQAEEARLQRQQNKVKRLEVAEKKEQQRLLEKRLMAIGRAWHKAGLLETHLDTDAEAMQEALHMVHGWATRRDIIEQVERASIERKVPTLMNEE